MKWNEALIISAMARQTFASKCLLLVNNCSWTGSECDVLGVTHDLKIIDIEVKISRADLRADAKKDKWWQRNWDFGLHQLNASRKEWPTKIWKHYYAMPEEIWTDDLAACLPSVRSGVLLLKQCKPPQPPVVVRCWRRAQPNRQMKDRLSSQEVIDIARLANLRMWDAYRQIDTMSQQATLPEAA